MTLSDLMQRGIDAYKPHLLEGVPLMDFVPSLKMGSTYSFGGAPETAKGILENWTKHFRATGTPYIIAHDEGGVETVSLWKEEIEPPIGPGTRKP